jgi:hypothetical protein
VVLAGAAFSCVSVSTAPAQFSSSAEAGARPALPRVFLDCQGRFPCDRTHFRTEIRFVNWAQDREDSDVHVIVTREATGGGGQHYTFDFIGRAEMANLSDRLTYSSRGADVYVQTRDGLTHVLRLGLLRYAVQGGWGGDFDVRFTRDVDTLPNSGDQDSDRMSPPASGDPWNYWTFQVGLWGDLDLRETRRDTWINPSVEADRITEDWKMRLYGRLDFRRDRRQLSDGSEVRDDRSDWRVNTLIVRSVSGHFSMGIDVEARNSIGQNQHARLTFNPAVEYNYFPYAQANRRQLIAHYSVGVEHTNYREETVFGVNQETIPQHKLGVQYNAREPWGNAGIGISASQYLHDSSLYSTSVRGNLNLRIMRGLSLNMSGNLAWENDVINTPASAISDEDILLGRQSLPSSYRYRAGIGFTYQWGSSFANVVNTRFPGSVR